jgi:hypothetical protein
MKTTAALKKAGDAAYSARQPRRLGWPSFVKETRCMSEKHPECPLYNPLNCKEYYNPKLCAFVRYDKTCLKKKKPETQERSEA